MSQQTETRESHLRAMLAEHHATYLLHSGIARDLAAQIGAPCICDDDCVCQSDELNRRDAERETQAAHAAALMANSIAILISREPAA